MVRVEDVAPVPLGDGQVRISVRAAAVNYPDVLLVANEYQIKVPTPFIPGSEFAGVVAEVAAGVTAPVVGDRVMGTSLVGAFAEEVIFRGVLQRHFIERFGLWRGIVFVGIIWAAFHFYGDSYRGLGDLEIVYSLFSRVLFCLILGFILAWLTLRSKSLIPATLAHGMNNVFAYSKPEASFPGRHWVYLGLLALLAYVLFRYWPVETKPDELSSPPAEATATEAAV